MVGASRRCGRGEGHRDHQVGVGLRSAPRKDGTLVGLCPIGRGLRSAPEKKIGTFPGGRSHALPAAAIMRRPAHSGRADGSRSRSLSQRRSRGASVARKDDENEHRTATTSREHGCDDAGDARRVRARLRPKGLEGGADPRGEDHRRTRGGVAPLGLHRDLGEQRLHRARCRPPRPLRGLREHRPGLSASPARRDAGPCGRVGEHP